MTCNYCKEEIRRHDSRLEIINPRPGSPFIKCVPDTGYCSDGTEGESIFYISLGYASEGYYCEFNCLFEWVHQHLTGKYNDLP